MPWTLIGSGVFSNELEEEKLRDTLSMSATRRRYVLSFEAMMSWYTASLLDCAFLGWLVLVRLEVDPLSKLVRRSLEGN